MCSVESVKLADTGKCPLKVQRFISRLHNMMQSEKLKAYKREKRIERREAAKLLASKLKLDRISYTEASSVYSLVYLLPCHGRHLEARILAESENDARARLQRHVGEAEIISILCKARDSSVISR